MKVKGIKRGQNIELLEQINEIPDGTEIIINLKISSLSSGTARKRYSHTNCTG